MPTRSSDPGRSLYEMAHRSAASNAAPAMDVISVPPIALEALQSSRSSWRMNGDTSDFGLDAFRLATSRKWPCTPTSVPTTARKG